MTDVVFGPFFTVNNRTLTEVSDGYDQTVSTFIGKSAYGVVTLDGQVPVAVDLNKIISSAEFITPALTYRDVVSIYFQTHPSDDVVVNFLPKVDRTTNRFEHRLKVYDPRATVGWTIDFGDIDNPAIRSDLDRVGTLDDLILTPPSDIIPENILVSVNGIMHKTIVFDGLIFVQDAYATIRQTGQFEIVVADTTTLGGHQIIPITEDMICVNPDHFLSYVNLASPSLILDGKSVLLSLDGYLQVFNELYAIRDRSSITIKPNRIDYIENYLYSPSMRRVRDVMAVTNVSNPYDPSQVIVPETGPRYRDRNDAYLYAFVDTYTIPRDQLTSFAFFKQRLLSPHSFLVLINNPHVYRLDYALITRGESRMFESYVQDMPRGLLFYGRGYLFPYTSTYNLNSNQHLIFIDQEDRRSKVYQSGMNSPAFPSARMDWRDDTLRPDARMIELYGGGN